jgi:hypothetical protein
VVQGVGTVLGGRGEELVFFFFENPGFSLAPVAHTWNPSYSGGRDQED